MILYRDNGEAWETVSPAESPTPVGAKYDIIWGLFVLGNHYILSPEINTIYATPVMIPYPLTISHLCLPIFSQSGNVKAAIYDDEGATPGASPAGASRLAITASELVTASYTRMDMALTEPLIVSAPGLKWLAVKADDATAGLTKSFGYWSKSAGPSSPAWAPNAYQVDPEGVYGDDMPDSFPADPTVVERAVAMGVLVQTIP